METAPACDARAKIALLVLGTAALFLTHRWAGMALGAFGVLAAFAALRAPLGRAARMLTPLYGVLAFMLLFGSLAPYGQPAAHGGFGLERPLLASAAPIAVNGALTFHPAGFEAAAFNGARIVLLALGSLAVSLSTPSNELVDAVRSLLRPLGRMRLPVDDTAMALGMAVRFIPLVSEHVQIVRTAHAARGASFDAGGLPARLRAWGRVLVPVFVGMFRRADRLAQAMDCRCYGACERRISLTSRAFGARDAAVLAAGALWCALCALA